jgi:ATP synthase F1 subcomplex delta subunit 
VINNAIARRYAKALVQLGSEKDLIDRFSQELKGGERGFCP